jgi:hypothetical protein
MCNSTHPKKKIQNTSKKNIQTKNLTRKTPTTTSKKKNIKKQLNKKIFKKKPPKKSHKIPIKTPNNFLYLFNKNTKKTPTLNNNA